MGARGGPKGRKLATATATATVTATLAVGALLLGACVATAAPLPPRRAETPPRPVATASEDAPPRPEGLPADAAWVPGHWHWNGVENEWIPGRWEVPPGGATYAP